MTVYMSLREHDPSRELPCAASIVHALWSMSLILKTFIYTDVYYNSVVLAESCKQPSDYQKKNSEIKCHSQNSTQPFNKKS